tara:strand:+ start:22 stop:252 length:231 start_codon:yes stop_codon:yes gene_type:complete
MNSEWQFQALTAEQEYDNELRWQVLMAQTPGETRGKAEWLDAWMSPVILTPEILDILGDVPLECEFHEGLPVYRVA